MKRTIASCSLALLAAGCTQGIGTSEGPPVEHTAVAVEGLGEARGREPALCREVADAFDFANQRLHETVAFLKATYPDDFTTYYPSHTYTSGPSLGEWDLRPRPSPLVNSRVTDWRSGYFAGAFWQLYAATHAPDVLGFAEAWTAPIESLVDTPLDYDIGGRFYRSFGDALRVLGPADDPSGAYRRHARDVLIRAAFTLDERFDMNGIPVGALRSLDDYPEGPYPVYIDGMVNVPLLFEGWRLAGSPSCGDARRLYDHGVTHSVTVMRGNVRPDGSTYHIVQYDDGTYGTPPDGKVYDKITDQGFAAESTWSRGQAWALYGFTVVYRYTRDDPSAHPERFLATAEATADYFISHLPNDFAADPYDYRPGDFVPPSDFDAALGEPAGPYNDANHDHVFGDRRPGTHRFTERDSSAAAIAASGLFDLSTVASTAAKRARYRRAAERILGCLLTYRGADGKLLYLAKDSVHRGLLANASTSYGDPTGSLIQGDYYFLEAMNRYRRLTPECGGGGR